MRLLRYFSVIVELQLMLLQLCLASVCALPDADGRLSTLVEQTDYVKDKLRRLRLANEGPSRGPEAQKLTQR